MKKLLAILLAAMMVFALAACDTGDDPNPSGSNNPGTSQNGGENNNSGENNNGGEENKDDVKYVMTLKETTNPNPKPNTNWTVSYKVFEFGETYLKSAYYVYKFDSAEDAEKFMTHKKETMGTLNEMKLDGTTVYEYDDSYDGASFSTVKSMFDESEYTLTEK